MNRTVLLPVACLGGAVAAVPDLAAAAPVGPAGAGSVAPLTAGSNLWLVVPVAVCLLAILAANVSARRRQISDPTPTDGTGSEVSGSGAVDVAAAASTDTAPTAPPRESRTAVSDGGVVEQAPEPLGDGPISPEKVAASPADPDPFLEGSVVPTRSGDDYHPLADSRRRADRECADMETVVRDDPSGTPADRETVVRRTGSGADEEPTAAEEMETIVRRTAPEAGDDSTAAEMETVVHRTSPGAGDDSTAAEMETVVHRTGPGADDDSTAAEEMETVVRRTGSDSSGDAADADDVADACADLETLVQRAPDVDTGGDPDSVAGPDGSSVTADTDADVRTGADADPTDAGTETTDEPFLFVPREEREEADDPDLDVEAFAETFVTADAGDEDPHGSGADGDRDGGSDSGTDIDQPGSGDDDPFEYVDPVSRDD